MKRIIQQIRQELTQNSDPHTASTGQNFFKENVKIYGVKTDCCHQDRQSV